jgi:lipoprotein-releasing system permease protein
MVSRLEWFIALRYLRAKKKESIISVIAIFSLLGVALGVAALIVVMAVMNGFHTEISNKMTGFNGDILITGRNGVVTSYEKVVAQLTQNKEIQAATSIIDKQVMATTKAGASAGVAVKGVSLKDLKQRKMIANNIIYGNIEDFQEANIIIGNELARNLRINVGDQITLISPQGTATVMGMIPRIKTFNIIGVFKSGMYLYDSSTVFMPLDTAQTYFKLPHMVNNIELILHDKNHSDTLATKLYINLGPDYLISDWKVTNASYFEVLKTERVVMFIILTLIIVVAAFNIISSLIMLVRDKTKDIAILRTMGATSGSILRIFTICGSLIGIIGTMLGACLGLEFALNIENIRQLLQKITGNTIFDPVVYYLSSLPADVKIADVSLVISISLALSFFATIFPAYKAAKTDPVQGLRYE